MKPTKVFLTLMCTVLFYATMMAQGVDRISIGPRAGINFSNVTNLDESESVTGLALGLTSTYSFNERTGLTLDVLYSVEGYQAPFETYKLRYLQIPIYFDLFFGELGNRFRPKIYAGVSPSFMLGGTLNDLDVNKTFYQSFILHATGGLGFNYRVGNRIWLNTDLRAFLGLDDIRDADGLEGEPRKPRTVQLSLGLAYGLSKL